MTPEINLLPRIDRKANVKSTLPFIVLAGIVVIALSYFIYAYITANSTSKRLAVDETALQGEQDTLQQQLASLQNTTAGSLAEAVDFAQKTAYPATPLMDEVQKYLVLNSYLRQYQFGEDKLELTIDFETMQDASLYVERLVMSSFFSDVQVEAITNFEVGKNTDKDAAIANQFKVIPRYNATITCTIDYTYLVGGRSQ